MKLQSILLHISIYYLVLIHFFVFPKTIDLLTNCSISFSFLSEQLFFYQQKWFKQQQTIVNNSGIEMWFCVFHRSQKKYFLVQTHTLTLLITTIDSMYHKL